MKQSDIKEITAVITDVQRFCMHDGPGIRTTVFFKGCPLHCKWCHNPETQAFHPQLSFTPSSCVMCGACAAVCRYSAQKFTPSREVDFSLCTACGSCAAVCPAGALGITGESVTVASLMDTVMKDAAFYGDDGGLTVSGGEPTSQPEALTALLGAAKAAGISTALETCGVFPEHLAGELCPLTDLFLFDIKDTDERRLRENTGAELSRVIANLRAADAAGGVSVLRCIMIPDVNMDEAHCGKLAELFGSLANCRYVELLPYHPYGSSKAERVGMPEQKLFGIPEREDIAAFAASLKEKGVPVKYFGTEMKR